MIPFREAGSGGSGEWARRSGPWPSPEASPAPGAPWNGGAASGGNDDRGVGPSGLPRLPVISMPKGGGAIRDIGENFAANPATGTGTLSLPVPLSPARRGFTPSTTLAYDSGSGGGVFGLGWRLDVPAITRRTDRGVPRYRDGGEPGAEDVFQVLGGDDLVPLPGGRRPRG
ncbi:SpvB/TcaC N-terminal domain-containing protein, partial [Streptosporangium carneum]|uniref:SpvB/TcaC N-terminal domain-containing protein n=1 Tax=Streptosporangium carneum TaxID=47481 RepID=UPI0031EB287F